MTERRRSQERATGQARPAAGAPPAHAPEDDAVLALQELAGNRAVSELFGGTAGGSAPSGQSINTSLGPSSGLRVRDLLRGLGRDSGPGPAMTPAVQRVTLDEKETAVWEVKAAYQEKSADAEKGAWEEKLP